MQRGRLYARELSPRAPCIHTAADKSGTLTADELRVGLQRQGKSVTEVSPWQAQVLTGALGCCGHAMLRCALPARLASLEGQPLSAPVPHVPFPPTIQYVHSRTRCGS